MSSNTLAQRKQVELQFSSTLRKFLIQSNGSTQQYLSNVFEVFYFKEDSWFFIPISQVASPIMALHRLFSTLSAELGKAAHSQVFCLP